MKFVANTVALLVSLMLFIAVPSCYAMPQGNPPSDAQPSSLTSPRVQSQTELNDDAASDFTSADREMTRVYAAVLKKNAGDKVFVAKFRAAQRAWLVFRDAEVAAQFPDADPRAAYGSMYPMCVSNLKTELTLNRIEQMKRWRDGEPEENVCAGSVPIKRDAD